MSKRRARTEWTWRTVVLLIVFLLLAWLLREFAGIDLLGGGEVTDTVAGDWIAVYFTTPRYPDDPALHTGSVDLHLVDLIDAAQQRVDVAAYQLNLPTVTDALLRAHRRGVQVRLVTDGEYEGEEMVARLRRAGVPVTVRPKDGGIMHNKFVVVDGAWVWTGSWNLTENCTYRNNNNAVLIASRHLAEDYATEFEELFSGKFGPGSPKNTPYPTVVIEVPEKALQVPVEVYFAPEDKVASHLIPVLSGARQSIRFMAFSFTSQDIADALMERARQGVSVEGVVEGRSADAAYAQYARLQEAGVPVWKDGNPYLLHHKVFIVDGETVVLGSYNFTGNAEKDNDENLLIIHNPEVAQAFLDEYARVWQQAEK
ncbi:MAG: phospholipase [Thermoflexales bacterium]|nr:phospholipase [Thermoflexales bacterium]